MTPSDLKQEAEKIIQEMDCDSCQYSREMWAQMTGIILTHLQSIWNAAKEEDAKITEDQPGCDCGCQPPECEDTCAERIRASQIPTKEKP